MSDTTMKVRMEERRRWADTEEALESVKAGRLVESKMVSEWLKSWGIEASKPPPEA